MRRQIVNVLLYISYFMCYRLHSSWLEFFPFAIVAACQFVTCTSFSSAGLETSFVFVISFSNFHSMGRFKLLSIQEPTGLEITAVVLRLLFSTLSIYLHECKPLSLQEKSRTTTWQRQCFL